MRRVLLAAALLLCLWESASAAAPILSSLEPQPLLLNYSLDVVTLTDTLVVSGGNGWITGARVVISEQCGTNEDELTYSTTLGISGAWDGDNCTLTLSGNATNADYTTALRTITFKVPSRAVYSTLKTLSFVVYGDKQGWSNTRTRGLQVYSALIDTYNCTFSGDAHVEPNPGSTRSGTGVFYYDKANQDMHYNLTFVNVDLDWLQTPTNDDDNALIIHFHEGPRDGEGSVIFGIFRPNYRPYWRNAADGTIGGLWRGYNLTRYDDDLRDGRIYVNVHTYEVRTGEIRCNLDNVNDRPYITTVNYDDVSYEVNSPPMTVWPDSAVEDADIRQQMSSMVVSIRGSDFVSGEDWLQYIDTDGITSSFDSGTGVLTLSGASDQTYYADAISSITYYNSEINGGTAGTRRIYARVSDGSKWSPWVQRDVIVTTGALPQFRAQMDFSQIINGGTTVYDGYGVVTMVYDSANDYANTTFYLFESCDFDGLQSLTTDDDAMRVMLGWGSEGTEGAGNNHNMCEFFDSGGVVDISTGTRVIDATYPNAYMNGGWDGAVTTKLRPNQLTAQILLGNIYAELETTGFSNGAMRGQLNPLSYAPVIFNIPSDTLAYIENAVEQVAPNCAIDRPSGDDIHSAMVWFSSGYRSSEDRLQLVPATQNGITGVFDSGTGYLSLTGKASPDDYQTALRTVEYYNELHEPYTGATRTVSWQIDGGMDENDVSSVRTRVISVTEVNDVPTLTASVSDTYVEEGPDGMNVFGDAVLGDLDHTSLAQATITVSSGWVDAEDSLTVTLTTNLLSSSWDNANDRLTISGSASVSAYQEAIRAVTFTNNEVDPTTGFRTFDLLVEDGVDPSVTVSRRVAVYPVPDFSNIPTTSLSYRRSLTRSSPLLSADVTLTHAFDSGATCYNFTATISSNYLSAEDYLNFTTTYVFPAGTSFTYSGGVLTFTGDGSLTEYADALANLVYININSIMPDQTNRDVDVVVTCEAAGSLATWVTTRTVSRTLDMSRVSASPGGLSVFGGGGSATTLCIFALTLLLSVFYR